MSGAGEAPRLLEVVDLRAEFQTTRGRVRAVDGVSFEIRSGECLAVVGETGSGKSAMALALLRLLPDPPGRITGGRVLYRGQDVLELDPEDLPAVRGREMAMVFQEPGSALNPVLTVGQQLDEAARIGLEEEARARRRSPAAIRRRVITALTQAGVPSPARRLGQYPHELSGGQKQRVMIAMALASGPSLLIADEPTTALDATVQARFLDLLAHLQAHLGLGLLLITHDLGVVARLADQVAVMYAGELVETAPVREFFGHPAHPYSRGLLAAARMTRTATGGFLTLDGPVPDPLHWPGGCRFGPRCPARVRPSAAPGPAAPSYGGCRRQGVPPPVRQAGPHHLVRCWLAVDTRRPSRPVTHSP